MAFCIWPPRRPAHHLTQFNTCHQANAADISYQRVVLQGPDGIDEVIFECGGAQKALRFRRFFALLYQPHMPPGGNRCSHGKIQSHLPVRHW